MAIPKFLEVTVNILGLGKQTVTIERGCSFENNGKIYRVNNDCKLSIFDKAKQTWEAGKEITMTQYQMNAFKSVADNCQDNDELGNLLTGLVLSKDDIDEAKKLYKKSSLNDDLNKNLNKNYKSEDATFYNKYDGFSANITNGTPTQSATLIFKYGEAKDAEKLSEIVAKDNEKKSKKTETENTKNTKSQKADSIPKAPVQPQKANNAPASIAKPQNTGNATPADANKHLNTEYKNYYDINAKPVPNYYKSEEVTYDKYYGEEELEKHYYNRSTTTEIPEFYAVKKNNLANKLGITVEQLDEKIAHTAKECGYSEYFITHIISTEDFVSPAKNIGDGTITAGFGHTSSLDKSIRNLKGKPISIDKAFEWIVSDIKFFESKVKDMVIDKDNNEKFDKYFDKLPLSLREAIIDVAFNRDASKLGSAEEYKYLRANIKNGEEYLPATAVRLRQDFSKYTYQQKTKHKFTRGLMTRNVYRFLLAIRDFDTDYRAAAKRRFENENSYYTETVKLQQAKGNAREAQLLKQAWDNIE